jgi:ribosome recycling factor
MRTGKLSVQQIETIKVKLQGDEVLPIKALGNILIKNPRLLSVSVFDSKVYF